MDDLVSPINHFAELILEYVNIQHVMRNGLNHTHNHNYPYPYSGYVPALARGCGPATKMTSSDITVVENTFHVINMPAFLISA